MQVRQADGSAGDANYGVLGKRYASFRQPDPRIAAVIERALGDARSVLNVGAGAGSYEPTDRDVVAVEPSAAWDEKYGKLRSQPWYSGSLHLIVSRP